MTLTPLAPLQGPQPQAVGTLPGIPAPMQPVAGVAPPSSATSQPWFQDVQSNFQAAHGTFDPLAAGLAAGEIGVPHPGVAGWAVGVVPQDPPGTTTQDNGGGNWQPGPNSTQYNNGVDQGPQTQGYNPGVGPGHIDSQGNWIPSTNEQPSDPMGGRTPMSQNDSGPTGTAPGLTPFTNDWNSAGGSAPSGYKQTTGNGTFDYSQPGALVPIIDNSAPGGFDIGGGGGDT